MDPVEVTKTSSTLFAAFIFIHSEVAVSSTPLGRPAALEAAAPEEAAAFKETLSYQRLLPLWLIGHHPLLSQKALRHSSSAKKLHKQTQRAIQRQRSNAAALKRQHGFPRGRPTHTNGCGKVRRRKVLRKERKDRKGETTQGSFRHEHGFLPGKQSHCSTDFKSLEVRWSHRPRQDL